MNTFDNSKRQQILSLVAARDLAGCTELCRRLAENKADWSALVHIAEEIESQGDNDFYAAIRDCRPDLADEDGNLPLHDAALDANVERVRSLLERGADANAANLDGIRPLHLFLRSDYTYTEEGILDLLLQHGADPTVAEEEHGETPLHILGYCGSSDFAAKLIEAGADINALDKAGRTPTDAALQEKNTALCIYLLGHGGKTSETLRSGKEPEYPSEDAWRSYPRTTALHRCVVRNSLSDIDYLLDVQKMDVNAPAAGGNTPLHFAVLSRQKEAAEHLLKRGADINARGANGQTPLMMAVRDCSLEMCRVLLAHGADLAPADNDGHDVMHYAEYTPTPGFPTEGYPLQDIRRLLEEAGGTRAPAPEWDWYVNNNCWAEVRSVREAAIALRTGMTVDDRDWFDGDTLLEWAAFEGLPGVAHYLLERGANPNAWGEQDYPPLFSAARQGHEEIVLMLLEYGADPHRCVYGKNALDNAEKGSRVARLLRSRGADDYVHGSSLLYYAYHGCDDYEWHLKYDTGNVNEADDIGNTPLHYAIRALRYGVRDARLRVSLLLKHGADIYRRNRAGIMPLGQIFFYFTCGGKGIDTLEILKDTDINRLDGRGFNALHYAIRSGEEKLVQSLLAMGADPLCGTGRGRSPLGLAQELGETAIATLLKAYDTRDTSCPPRLLETELKEACRKGDVPRIRELLEAGADPDGDPCGIIHPWDDRPFNDGTPLYLLGSGQRTEEEWTEAAKLLLEAGANVHREIDDATALVEAVAGEHPGIVKLLLQAGADPNHSMPHPLQGTYMTPLSFALPCGHAEKEAAECMELLLEYGAELFRGSDALNRDRDDTYSPLGWLVQEDNGTILEHLLGKGLPVNERDDDGNTLLHYTALCEGTPATARLLLAHGADATLRNYAGKTAQELAQERHNTELCAFLLNENRKGDI